MIEWQHKRRHQAENPFIGWICDAYDSVKGFFTDPYLIDRLLKPAGRLIEHSEAVSDRRQAAAAVRNEKKNADRIRRARNKEYRARRRQSFFQKFTLSGVRNAVGVLAVCSLVITMGYMLSDNIKKIIASTSVPIASASDIDSGANVPYEYGGADAFQDVGADAGTDIASEDSAVTDLEKEYASVEDTQAVVYAESNREREGSENPAPQSSDAAGGFLNTGSQNGSSPASQTNYPPVYIDNKGSILLPSDFGHGHRFAGLKHRLMMDVSSNQGKVDWDRASVSGIEAAMIRVGYRGRNSGKLYEDDCYKYNLRETRKAGLPIGVYFYSQAITVAEAKEEAQFLLDRIGKYDIRMPVAIDYEYESMSVYGELSGRLYDAHLSVDDATNIVLAFCREIAAKGYTPMVYANKDMLSNSLDSYSISGKYKVWLACYAKRATYGDVYNYWQFTDSGRVDGVNGNVCLDFWYCDQ